MTTPGHGPLSVRGPGRVRSAPAQSYDASATRRGSRPRPRATVSPTNRPTPARAMASRGTSSPAMTSMVTTARATRRMAGPSRSRRAWSLPQAPSVTAVTPCRGSRTLARRPGSTRSWTGAGAVPGYGYGQPDQQDVAAAQARGQQEFAAQPPAAEPQQWQDAARTGQPTGAPGYPASAGGGSTLSAPVPPDNGGAGQQSPGARPRRRCPSRAQGSRAARTVRRFRRDRPVRGFLRRAARLRAAGRLPGSRPAARYAVARRTLAPGTARAPPRPATPAGTAPAAGYPPRRNAYAYDLAGYAGNGHAGGYGEGERGGTGAFPAGYPATNAPSTGAYPEAPGANGYAANGYGNNGYEANGYAKGSGTEYQANGYAANGSDASDYPGAEAGGQGIGAVRRVPAPSRERVRGRLRQRPRAG